MAKKKDIAINALSLGTDTLFPQSYSSIKFGERARFQQFHKELKRASVEEDVKAAYRTFFSLPQDSSDNRDLYTPQILFEFKYDRDFRSNRVKAEVLAQILYYVHRLKFESGTLPVPPFLCLADYNETLLTETLRWEVYYNDDQYDWEAAPSSPDMKLVQNLEKEESLRNLHVFPLFELNELQVLHDTFSRIYENDIDKSIIVKKDITERNFEDIYQSWFSRFGEDVRNGRKPSQYFICDIQEGKTYVREDTGRVYFDIEEGVSVPKKLNIREYIDFWTLYNKNRAGRLDTIQGIMSKADRLSGEEARRFEGEFYTPIHLAQRAIDYLDLVIGGEQRKIDWDSGEYRLWDMACGTGNLEYHLPSKAYRYCYMSTLRPEDVVYCKRVFHEATVFQYDYLNDDITRVIKGDKTRGWKMPQKLVDDLANPDLKWIIYINPPFGTAQNKMDAANSKKDISMTATRVCMTEEKMGETSRELFSQFLYRINKEFRTKQAWLGLFSTLKYLNANNDQIFRNNIFRYKFERGFIFEGSAFEGLKPGFPIGFLVWDLSHWPYNEFDTQSIIVEKCRKTGIPVGTKELKVIDRKWLLNKWTDRPAATITFPPFSSALNVNYDKKDLRDRISARFICSLCSKSSDMQNNNSVALFSGPYGSAGALSVTPLNFLRAMIIHAVRKTAKGDWSNDRDQFYIPFNRYFHEEVIQQFGYQPGITPEFPMDFARDCVVWSLFAASNQTVSLKDIEYKGKTYQIPNNLFPFTIAEVKKWGISDPDIAPSIMAEDEDRFAAKWVFDNLQQLSIASRNVLQAAKTVYKIYFDNLHKIHTTRYKIRTWDAGRYQIFHSMKDAEIGQEEWLLLEEEHKKLGEKIRTQLYTLGFLR